MKSTTIVAGLLVLGTLSSGGVASASGPTTTTIPKGPYGWIEGRLVQKNHPDLPALCTVVIPTTLQPYTPPGLPASAGAKAYLPAPHLPIIPVNRYGYYRFPVPVGQYSLLYYPAFNKVKGCPTNAELPSGAPTPGFYVRNFYNGTSIGAGPWGTTQPFTITAGQTFHVITTAMWTTDIGAYRGQPIEGRSTSLALYGDGFSMSSTVTTNAPGVTVGKIVTFAKSNPISLSPVLTTNLVISKRARPGTYLIEVTTPSFGVASAPLTLSYLPGTTVLSAALGVDHLTNSSVGG